MESVPKDPKASGCCSISFLKCILFFFTILSLGLGGFLLATGLWSLLDPNIPLDLQASPSLALATFAIISTGATLVFVGFLACIGVIKEVKVAVCIYAIFLAALLITEVWVALFAYLHEDKVYEELSSTLNKTFMETYGFDEQRTESIDNLQRQFKCCGAARYEDWVHSLWIKHSRLNNTVPDSCCKSETPSCGIRDHPSNIYYDGCIHGLEKLITEHLTVLAAVTFGVCLAQILAILFSICLFVKLKKLKENPY
ncbi:hypothetical protein QYM36_011610 [Artemia franciscana]|uniref:Tetraspanin n=1 Tax=Artemia franciscana TaxID=6661 RepID=A0AA88HVL5_ARTSF|nr:hypothetical protein QYM36_011610 [Artemia franciscana]